MAGLGQPCKHVAAAMYRIEAAVRNGLTNPSCTSTANQWLPKIKDVEPMKVKDMNFGCEDFCQRSKKKRPFVSTPKKKSNPLSEQGDMKMLTLNDFAESLRDVCPESILFSTVPKPDVVLVTDLVEQQAHEVYLC